MPNEGMEKIFKGSLKVDVFGVNQVAFVSDTKIRTDIDNIASRLNLTERSCRPYIGKNHTPLGRQITVQAVYDQLVQICYILPDRGLMNFSFDYYHQQPNSLKVIEAIACTYRNSEVTIMADNALYHPHILEKMRGIPSEAIKQQVLEKQLV